MKFGSAFSGIGGFDLGLERAGMQAAFQIELDEYRASILKRHWPDVPLYGDVMRCGRTTDGQGAAEFERRVLGGVGQPRRLSPAELASMRGTRRWIERTKPVVHELPEVDMVTGGFPCRDLSYAGSRRGVDAEGTEDGSQLFFELARVANELVRPGGWVLIENVPGMLTSSRGRDFGVVLRTLGDVGFHDLAWRVLDSSHFGVPQLRRRVYILGRRADGRRARDVLLDGQGGGGHPGPRTPRRQAASPGPEGGAGAAAPLGWEGRSWLGYWDQCPTLIASRPCGVVPADGSVRYMTPVEQERMQGFPDGWTIPEGPSLAQVPAYLDGGPANLSLPKKLNHQRWEATGRAVTVPVAEWIAGRVLAAEAQQPEEVAAVA